MDRDSESKGGMGEVWWQPGRDEAMNALEGEMLLKA